MKTYFPRTRRIPVPAELQQLEIHDYRRSYSTVVASICHDLATTDCALVSSLSSTSHKDLAMLITIAKRFYNKGWAIDWHSRHYKWGDAYALWVRHDHYHPEGFTELRQNSIGEWESRTTKCEPIRFDSYPVNIKEMIRA